MNNYICYFRLYDPEPCYLYMIPPEDDKDIRDVARPFNDDKWAIFWCPNMNYEPDVDGKVKREASRVRDEHIKFWYCDIDKGSKQEQWLRIKESPLQPTMMVETKNGFHLYWKAEDATVQNFTLIEKRIIEYFDADKRAKDIVRLLRLWGFKHWKDEDNPFDVVIRMIDVNMIYTEKQMLTVFPESYDESKVLQVSDRQILRRFASSDAAGDNIFDKVKRMDQKKLLEKLSGTEYVGGEVYDIRLQPSGNHNIYVNKKSTSCFLNEAGDIVADKHYGKNVINWLKWYNHTPSEIYQILRIIAEEAFE